MECAGYAIDSFDSAEQFLASGSARNAACRTNTSSSMITMLPFNFFFT